MSHLKYIIFCSVFVIVSACAVGRTRTPGMPDAISPRPTIVSADAEQGFKEARDAYKAGNAENALFIAHRVNVLFPDTPWYKRSLFLTEQALIRLDRMSEADAAMLRVQAEYPELGDYALFLLADYRFAKARYSEAAALYEQVSVRYPGSSLIKRAAFQRAKALLESPAYPEAAAAFDEFLQNNQDSEFAPAAGLGLGRALIAQEDFARAVRAYQDVWIRYPGASNDQEVEQSLAVLKSRGVEVPELASAELYDRGRNLFRAKLHDKAVESFRKYLEKEPDSSNRSEVLYRTGISLYYLGKRGEAALILEKMIREYPSDELAADALYWLGKTYSKLGDWERGVQTFERLLEGFPGSEWCDEALFLTGNIFREANDTQKAIEFYGRLVNEYPDSRFADSALWWKAWWFYTSAEYVNADHAFQDLINRYPRSFLVNQALYWQGRAAEKRDDPDQAAEYYRQVLKKGPYTYYGHRTAERMAALGSAAGVPADDAADTATAFVEAPYRDDAPDASGSEFDISLWTDEMKQMLAANDSLQKILELVHLDMKAEAAAELWSLKDTVPRRRVALMELSKVFFELGDYHRSLAIVLKGYEKSLGRPAHGMSDDLWLLAYPQAYWDSIVTYAGKFKQDPYFIAAIIRQESRFRPDAISSAGARGLMQVMPATGKWVAEQNKLSEFDREQLFDSDTAINIGTWYVSHLMKQFQNDPLLVAAAYNAGPEAVQGWIAKNGFAGEGDLFVEMIPYAETRRYVKKVLGDYAEYKRIYAKTAGAAAFGMKTAE